MADMTREQAVEQLRIVLETQQGDTVTMYRAVVQEALTALTAQPAGEAVAWLCDAGDGENIDATNSASARDTYARSGRTIIPLYAHPSPQQPDADYRGDAVQLTVCCGRQECGGECGNEWRGMEWFRKTDVSAPQQPADNAGAVAFGKLSECPPEFEAPPMTEAERAAKINEFKAKLTRAEAADQPGEKVRGLVEKWRQQPAHDLPGINNTRVAYEVCADELQAALSAKGEGE